MKEILLYFSIEYSGDWEKIYKAIENKEDVDFSKLKKTTKEYKGQYLTIVDKEYPNKLKMIDKPPFVIFYKGNLNLIYDEKTIWPVASFKVTNFLVDKMEGFTIAIGHSSYFEKEILNNNKSNIIVVKDCGIDNDLLISEEAENKLIDKTNLLISEYPSHTLPSKSNWEYSNRIKTGLSSSLVLINSLKERELFMIIANTIHEGKEVYCLYDNDDNNHNNVLIKKGAYGIKKISEIKY